MIDAAELWPTFAEHLRLIHPRGRSRFTRTGPRWWAVLTGEPHPDVNLGGLTSQATGTDAAELAGSIDAAGGCGAITVASAVSEDVAAVIEAAEFQRAPKREAIMWCERRPAQVESRFRIAPVTSEAGAAAAVALAAEGHQIPRLVDVIDPAPFPGEAVNAWLAWDGDQPLSVVWLTPGQRIGVWAMMTPERHRRRGAGRAVLKAALAATWRGDTKGAFLWSSPMGRPLYESVGFRALDECPIWVKGASLEIYAAIGNV